MAPPRGAKPSLAIAPPHPSPHSLPAFAALLCHPHAHSHPIIKRIVSALDGQSAAARAEHVARLRRLAEAEDADAVEVLEALLQPRNRRLLRRAHGHARVVVLLVRLVVALGVADLRLQVVVVLGLELLDATPVGPLVGVRVGGWGWAWGWGWGLGLGLGLAYPNTNPNPNPNPNPNLRVRIDVHLDDTVRDGLLDVLDVRARAWGEGEG